MSAALAWLAAAWVAWKRRSRLAWADFAAYVVGASSIPAWTVIMPTHTIIHAAFMTRILIVPISLGWAALLWQMWLRKNLLFVPARSVGDGIYSAMGVGKSVVCLPWFWRWIMAMMKIVPESLFKKINL